MSILIISPSRPTQEWEQLFAIHYPEEQLEVWPDVANPEEVEVVLLWNHPVGILNRFSQLRLISSMGAGVDHILRDRSIPAHIPITRIVDDLLSRSMNCYVAACVLHYHRRWAHFENLQRQKKWDMTMPEKEVRIGILGMGALGLEVAKTLQSLDFEVFGLTRRGNEAGGVPCYAKDQLDEFLAKSDVLVCMLPLTEATREILNAELFARLPMGACLINVARGAHLKEEDLLPALNSGQLSAAYLDVFQQEPLPEDHPFWVHPQIFISPHIASVTNPAATIPLVMDNVRRMRKGEPLHYQVDRDQGY
jgi:glyoxylate/hydroxypyruvate reductase A